MVEPFPWHCSFSRIRLMYWNAEYPFCCLTALPQCLHRWGWLLRIRFVLTETATAAELLLFVAWVRTCAWNCALPALCSPPCTGIVLCSSVPRPSMAFCLPEAVGPLLLHCNRPVSIELFLRSLYRMNTSHQGPRMSPQVRCDEWPVSSSLVLLSAGNYDFSYSLVVCG